MQNKSLEEIEELVKQGDLDAMCELAYRKFKGEGIEQDYKGAFELYKKASEKGSIKATYNLGNSYYYGD